MKFVGSVAVLFGALVLVGCVKDGKIGETKIWETPAETTAPKTIWRNDEGSQRNPPTTVWKRADGTTVIEADERDRRD